jgi:hypothetical protein
MDDPIDEAAAALRAHFIAWQCRIRQMAVRREGGRPSSGMRPAVLAPDGTEIAAAVTVVIAEADPEATTQEFRHAVRRTHDPRARYEAAIKFLAAAYFQHPEAFADSLFALFGPGSGLCRRLVELGLAVLVFREFGQSYRVPCAVEELGEDDPFWQAVYWHNALFNPAPPPHPRVLAFVPDWTRATAFPPVEASVATR